MKSRREIRRYERGLRSAQDRFKGGYANAVLIGLILSVGLHFALFASRPSFVIGGQPVADEELSVVQLPPEVRIPPPPRPVARPARPRISSRPVAEDLTIAPTTFEQHPAESLAPPPPERVRDVQDRPVYVTRDVEPRLRNADEIRSLLRRMYPSQLRDAGIGGRVMLWVFVQEDGRPGACRVHQSSGYAPLDRTAEKVAHEMRFSPALWRDRPVGVWIAQPIEFRPQDGG